MTLGVGQVQQGIVSAYDRAIAAGVVCPPGQNLSPNGDCVTPVPYPSGNPFSGSCCGEPAARPALCGYKTPATIWLECHWPLLAVGGVVLFFIMRGSR
jgi:hypothetical protein